MLTKQDFRALSNDDKVKLVNDELLKNKGTKDFGVDVFGFSYSFARNLLVEAGYDTFVNEDETGTRVKLFRKLTEEELAKKEEKQKEFAEPVASVEETTLPKARVVQLAEDIRENEKDEEIVRKTFPAFASTWEEFETLLKSEDFKIYEKKYLYDLVLRTFLEKYGDKSE